MFVGEFRPKIVIRWKLGGCFASFEDVTEGCYVTNVTIRFKGAVVTTKPRRRRRGRGAAAIIKKCGWMGGEMTYLDGRVPATANSEAGEGPLRRTRGMGLTTKNP